MDTKSARVATLTEKQNDKKHFTRALALVLIQSDQNPDDPALAQQLLRELWDASPFAKMRYRPALNEGEKELAEFLD